MNRIIRIDISGPVKSTIAFPVTIEYESELDSELQVVALDTRAFSITFDPVPLVASRLGKVKFDLTIEKTGDDNICGLEFSAPDLTTKMKEVTVT